MKLNIEQKKIKFIYEKFKDSNALDAQDISFIKSTESLLKTANETENKKVQECIYSLIYSKKWIGSWISTSNILKTIENIIKSQEQEELEMLKYLKNKYENE